MAESGMCVVCMTASGHHFAEAIHQRLAGMGAQVVHDQMDGLGGGIVRGDLQDEFGKLGGARVGVTLVK